jgi:hypothetical protein
MPPRHDHRAASLVRYSKRRGLICPSSQPRRAATARHDIQVAAPAAAFAGHLATAGSLLCVFALSSSMNVY